MVLWFLSTAMSISYRYDNDGLAMSISYTMYTYAMSISYRHQTIIIICFLDTESE